MQIDRNNKADAWLAHSQREQSGRLTIFLGAAPGVGKTFAMLSRAHELMGQGHHVCWWAWSKRMVELIPKL